MPRVHHMRVEQGFRPFTNPRPLAHLHGLGDNIFGTCVQGYDVNSNPVPCDSPSAVVLMDADSNTIAVPRGTTVSSHSVYGALQAGSQGVFQAALPWLVAGLLFVVARKR